MRSSCFAQALVLMLLLAGSLYAETECEAPDGIVFVGVRGEVVRRDLLCRTERNPMHMDPRPSLTLSACGRLMTARELQIAGAESLFGSVVELTRTPEGEAYFVVSIEVPTSVASQGCDEMRGSLVFGDETSGSEVRVRFEIRIEDVHSEIDERYLSQFHQECENVNCGGFDVVAFVAREISRTRASRYAQYAGAVKDGRMSQSAAWNLIENEILRDLSDSKFARQALRRERCLFSTSDYLALVRGDGAQTDFEALRAISVLGEQRYFEVCDFSEPETLIKRRSMGDESFDLEDLWRSESGSPERDWVNFVIPLLQSIGRE
jgi:hypothetical protein